MKIAVLGTRGIPARYGGFETLADELSRRLVDRGHEVTVYCRKPFTTPDDVFDTRIRRVILPTIRDKHFDTLFSGLLSILHVVFTNVDAILICNVANAPYAWIPRPFGKPTALNVDGLDRKRRKWNFLGQWFLHLCEVLAAFTPSRLVTDARAVQEYYRRRYRKSSSMIAYGAEPPAGDEGVSQFGLESRKYILYVARLEPENNPELVIRAYREVATDWPLVIVGGNTYRPQYEKYLQSMSDRRVVFTGPVYGDGYWALQKNAGLFIFAGEIGGIHPALVEAMAAGNAILYLDTPANRETTANAGIAFEADYQDLGSKTSRIIADPVGLEHLRHIAKLTAEEKYGWENVVGQYEQLFREMVGEPQTQAAIASSLEPPIEIATGRGENQWESSASETRRRA
jgi:glycosyltransferase involved in cell wall biosynthesis